MPIEHRKGDLFLSTDVEAIGHGCNTLGVMGKGVALKFKQRWPEMYKAYRALCQQSTFVPGDIFPYATDADSTPIVIYNLMTQGCIRDITSLYGGYIQLATLGAIEESFKKMITHANDTAITRIGLPKIGAGLGGLNWNDIEEILKKNCPENITVIIHSIES